MMNDRGTVITVRCLPVRLMSTIMSFQTGLL